jgi:hypothetical protein
MRSSNTEDHSTHEAIPGNESNYGETNARIFTRIDDKTRVIPAVEFQNVKFAHSDPPTAWAMCELGIKLRDLRDVSAIVVAHGLENVRFVASPYAGYGP